MAFRRGLARAGDYEAGKGDVVEALQAYVEPFVVSCEAPETGGPGEASLDDPSAFGSSTKPRLATGSAS